VEVGAEEPVLGVLGLDVLRVGQVATDVTEVDHRGLHHEVVVSGGGGLRARDASRAHHQEDERNDERRRASAREIVDSSWRRHRGSPSP
jgi:hypothetical protein